MTQEATKFKVGDIVRLVNDKDWPDHGYWPRTKHLHPIGVRGEVVKVGASLKVRIPSVTAEITTILGYKPHRWEPVDNTLEQLADHATYYEAITGDA